MNEFESLNEEELRSSEEKGRQWLEEQKEKGSEYFEASQKIDNAVLDACKIESDLPKEKVSGLAFLALSQVRGEEKGGENA